MEPVKEAKYNPFDAAVPGQSLTDTPGNSPWEHPPQMTNIHSISLFLFKQLTSPKMAEQVILLLKEGIPAEAIARVTLFAGFVEGKWNVDSALLVAQAVLKIIVGIGIGAKLESFKVSMDDNTNLNFRRGLADVKTKIERTAKKMTERMTQEAPMQRLPEAQAEGLMANPLKEVE